MIQELPSQFQLIHQQQVRVLDNEGSNRAALFQDIFPIPVLLMHIEFLCIITYTMYHLETSPVMRYYVCSLLLSVYLHLYRNYGGPYVPLYNKKMCGRNFN